MKKQIEQVDWDWLKVVTDYLIFIILIGCWPGGCFHRKILNSEKLWFQINDVCKIFIDKLTQENIKHVQIIAFKLDVYKNKTLQMFTWVEKMHDRTLNYT